jgi:RNA polymerase sigma-70 factor, ECF subfamily
LRQLSDRPAPPPPEEEERRAVDQLVERWQRGIDREETFRRLYVLSFQKVYRFFVRRGFPEDECMDLSQETFLLVHGHLQAFRGEAPFDTWMFKIAMNVYRNRLRTLGSLKRDAHVVPLDASPEEPLVSARPEGLFAGCEADEPLSSVLAEERARLLREAVEGLPAQMRRCVQLRVDRDLKYREIAVLLQVSVETVKAHLFQARQQLRVRLGAYFTDLSD